MMSMFLVIVRSKMSSRNQRTQWNVVFAAPLLTVLRIRNSHFVVIHIFLVNQYSTVNHCCVFIKMILLRYDHQVAAYARHFRQVF